MREANKTKLEKKGWKVGTVQELLELSDEEAAYMQPLRDSRRARGGPGALPGLHAALQTHPRRPVPEVPDGTRVHRGGREERRERHASKRVVPYAQDA
jgi:hypothetical protein